MTYLGNTPARPKATASDFDYLAQDPNAVPVNLEQELTRRFVTPQMFKEDGDPDDTASFERAANASRFVVVPFDNNGYDVDASVNVGGATFLFMGGFVKAQLIGTANLHDVNGISLHNATATNHRQRIEPPQNTLSGADGSGKKGYFSLQVEPDTTASNTGEGPWYFNHVICTWEGERTGTGLPGANTSATVHAWQINLNTGGPNYQLDSARALGWGLTHNSDDTSDGDKVGGGGGVRTSASSPGKIYGASVSFTVDDGGNTPQAVGYEADCFVQGTGIVNNAVGFNAWTGGEKGANNTYAAYAIGRSGAANTAAWKTGLMLYTSGGKTGQPLGTGASLIEADTPMTIGNVLDFPNVTINGNIIDTPNYTVTGAGNTIIRNNGGISFVNTSNTIAQGSTTTTEVMRDYEEGTWNPLVEDGTNAVQTSYGSRSGNFQKVGNWVHAICRVSIKDLESVTGNIRISGLPYNSSNDLRPAATIGNATGLNLSSGNISLAGYVDNGTDYINLRQFTAPGGNLPVTASEFSNTGDISLSVSYYVAP